MKATPSRQVVYGALFWLTIAAVGGAQSSTSRPESRPQETTIVGCVVQQSLADSGRERQRDPGAANPVDYFVRTPTVAQPVGSTIAVGRPGTTSTATSAGTPTTDSFYRITGLETDLVRAHVGHRVELKGTLTGESESATTAKTTVDATGRATTTTETRPLVAGVLRATAIKRLASSCQ